MIQRAWRIAVANSHWLAIAAALEVGTAWADPAPQPTTTTCAPTATGAAQDEPFLKWLNEPTLPGSGCPPGREVYRVVSYEYHLVQAATSVRVEVAADNAKVSMHKTNTPVGMNSGEPKLEFARDRALSMGEISQLRAAFDRSELWAHETSRNLKNDCIADDVEIIEVIRDGRYKRFEYDYCRPAYDALRPFLLIFGDLFKSLEPPHKVLP